LVKVPLMPKAIVIDGAFAGIRAPNTDCPHDGASE